MSQTFLALDGKLPSETGQLTAQQVREAKQKFKKHEKIVQAMTPEERRDPSLMREDLNDVENKCPRVQRLAREAGVSEKDVALFVAEFEGTTCQWEVALAAVRIGKRWRCTYDLPSHRMPNAGGGWQSVSHNCNSWRLACAASQRCWRLVSVSPRARTLTRCRRRSGSPPRATAGREGRSKKCSARCRNEEERRKQAPEASPPATCLFLVP